MRIEDIQWASPWWALLLIPVIILWYISVKKGKFSILNVPGPSNKNEYQSWRTRILPYIVHLPFIALLGCVIAMTQPQLQLVEESIEADALDIILAMDVSSSMLAEDFLPNRLEASKKVAASFVKTREYDRVGIVVFSGEAFTLSPLSLDKEIVLNFLKTIRAKMILDGTAIGLGLATAINRLKDSEAVSKVIILLSDGADTGSRIDPNTATTLAEEFGIKVYTIGMGTDEQTRIQTTDPFGRTRYQYIQGQVDEALMQRIARSTGGRYFRARSGDELKQIYDEIDRLERTPIEVNVIQRVQELFPLILMVSLILLFIFIALHYWILNTLET